MSVSAVIVGAGESRRYGKNKLTELIGGTTVFERSVSAFAQHPDIDEIIIVTSKALFSLFDNTPFVLVEGGATRAESVRNGVRTAKGEYVCIHDAARPFVSSELIARTVSAAKEYGAAAPFVAVSDSLRYVENGFVSGFADRSALFSVQTPQVFRTTEYLRALETASLSEGDDCEIAAKAGIMVKAVDGQTDNIKITNAGDIRDMTVRMGHGYDAHRLVEGRKLILCGVQLPYEKGLLGHSDADVAVHALMDALLGATALGDIGKLFPDNDSRYEGADSLMLLKTVSAYLSERGYGVVNVDITIICQRPKLAPHIEEMRRNIAFAMNTDIDRISVKATTEEGMGFTGLGEGISAHAIAAVSRK